MNFVVFESGSRAGLSAELFFEFYRKRSSSGDTLFLSDLDEDFSSIEKLFPQVERIHDSKALEMLASGDAVVFPADEITRQKNENVTRVASLHGFSRVEPWYYNKNSVNRFLMPKTQGCEIQVPPTFDTTQVCVRPNTLSAGSRNVQLLENACVTMKIDIAREFVVDVLRYDNNSIYCFPREVTLKNGYDRFIKLLPLDGRVAHAVKEFVTAVCPTNQGLFSNIFHLQLCEDREGRLFYIEFSKRISGTSCVNIGSGMSPFALIDGAEQQLNPAFVDGKWHRFEDFLLLR